MENSTKLIKTQNLISKVWEVMYKGERYLYITHYLEGGTLVNDYIQDQYGYDVNDETLKEDIYDFWRSQQ